MFIAKGDTSVSTHYMGDASVPTHHPNSPRPYRYVVVMLDFSQGVMLAFKHENTVTTPL